MIQRPESKFLKVKCQKCRNEQMVFNKAASVVKCLVCNSTLAKPTGGVIDVDPKTIIEILD